MRIPSFYTHILLYVYNFPIMRWSRAFLDIGCCLTAHTLLFALQQSTLHCMSIFQSSQSLYSSTRMAFSLEYRPYPPLTVVLSPGFLPYNYTTVLNTSTRPGRQDLTQHRSTLANTANMSVNLRITPRLDRGMWRTLA